jgi:secreted trypsin-like serine protease
MKLIPHRYLRRRCLTVGVACATLGAVVVAPSVPTSASGGRIVGGVPASEGEYPYFTALQFVGNGSPFDRQFCGGTLVAPQVVLTAAHCVEGTAAQDIEVTVGRTNLDDESSGEVIAVENIEVHPQFISVDNGYDVALLQLTEPSSAPTIELAGPDDVDLVQPDSPSTVIGHGTTSAGGQGSARLREVTVPIQDDQYMADRYNADGANYDAATMIGAGPIQGGQDSCQGDSGGPLMVFNGDTPKQIGIVSWGGTNNNPGCAIPDLPGIYSEVYQGELLQWVQDRL